jgi:hypothetical protein
VAGVAEQARCVTGEYRAEEDSEECVKALLSLRGSDQECPWSAWTEKVSRVRQTRW